MGRGDWSSGLRDGFEAIRVEKGLRVTSRRRRRTVSESNLIEDCSGIG
jgi:hypothetical protein